MSTKSGTPETIDAMKDRLTRLRLSVRIREAERLEKTLEMYGAEAYVNGYADYLNQFRAGVYNPISTAQDRRGGRNFPFFVSENDIAMYRAPARVMLGMNSYAQGMLSGLTSYVISDGMKTEATHRGAAAKSKAAQDAAKDPLVQLCQDIWEEFEEEEGWPELQSELFWRSREDGEYFLDHGFDEDTERTWVRTVEPEQIYYPTTIPDWIETPFGPIDMRRMRDSPDSVRFGVITDPEDVQTVFGYAVHHFLNPGIWEFLYPYQLIHYKINTKRSIKRGLTDFAFSTYDSLWQAENLRRNLSVGAAVRAAIAFFRQHRTASSGQVAGFVASQANRATIAGGPFGAKNQNYQNIVGGQVIDMDGQQEVVPSPADSAASGHLEILEACLLGAGRRWNAPQWLGSGTHDTGSFASSLTAESPFVKWGGRTQKSLAGQFARTWRIVMRHAVECGRLPPEALERVCPKITPPQIQVRDVLQQSQVDQTYVAMGEKSLKTVSEEQGRDYEEEQQRIAEHGQNGGGGQPLQMPGQDGQPPQKPPPAAGEKGPPKPPPGPTPEALTLEEFDESKINRADDGRFGKGNGAGARNPKLHGASRPDLSDKEIAEVESYLSEDTDYYDVNEHLRSGGKMLDTTLQDAISKAGALPEPVTVYRGFTADDPDALMEELESGEFTDRGFMSTSTSPSGAFKGNVRFVIKATHGLDASHYGSNSNEMLLPANSDFKVLSVKRDKGKIVAELEQIVAHKATESLRVLRKLVASNRQLVEALLFEEQARGQPDNAGQFASSPSSGGATDTKKKTHKERKHEAAQKYKAAKKAHAAAKQEYEAAKKEAEASPAAHAANLEATGEKVRASKALMHKVKAVYHHAAAKLEILRAEHAPTGLAHAAATACHMTMAEQIQAEMFSAGGAPKAAVSLAAKAAAYGVVKILKKLGG